MQVFQFRCQRSYCSRFRLIAFSVLLFSIQVFHCSCFLPSLYSLQDFADMFRTIFHMIPIYVSCRFWFLRFLIHIFQMLLYFFNYALMLFTFLVIINSHKQNITGIIWNRGWVFSVFNLLYCRLRFLVPFQFNNQCRISTFIFRLRDKNKIYFLQH